MGGEWATVRLDEVCDFRGGSVFTPELQGRSSGELPFVKVSDMNLPANAVRIQDANNWVSADDLRALRAKPLPAGSVVFAKIGEALRQNRLRQVTRETIVDNNMMGAVPRPNRIDARYLYYALSRFDFSDIAQGTALPYLTVASLSALTMEVPSAAEQRVIAHILGTLDDKIELNRRMGETLEAMARALFKSWFVDLDPVRATVAALIQDGLLEIGDGYRAKNSELGGPGLPFIRAGDLRGTLDTRGAEILCHESVAKAGGKVSRTGDVAFTSKGTIGRFARVAKTTARSVYSPQVCYWRSLDRARLDPVVLYCWMRSDDLGRQVTAVAGQTDMAPYVSLQDQRRMTIPVFPPSQAVVVQRIEPLLGRQSSNDEETIVLEALREALLPELLSGSIRLGEATRILGRAAG